MKIQDINENERILIETYYGNLVELVVLEKAKSAVKCLKKDKEIWYSESDIGYWKLIEKLPTKGITEESKMVWTWDFDLAHPVQKVLEEQRDYIVFPDAESCEKWAMSEYKEGKQEIGDLILFQVFNENNGEPFLTLWKECYKMRGFVRYANHHEYKTAYERIKAKEVLTKEGILKSSKTILKCFYPNGRKIEIGDRVKCYIGLVKGQLGKITGISKFPDKKTRIDILLDSGCTTTTHPDSISYELETIDIPLDKNENLLRVGDVVGIPDLDIYVTIAELYKDTTGRWFGKSNEVPTRTGLCCNCEKVVIYTVEREEELLKNMNRLAEENFRLAIQKEK